MYEIAIRLKAFKHFPRPMIKEMDLENR